MKAKPAAKPRAPRPPKQPAKSTTAKAKPAKAAKAKTLATASSDGTVRLRDGARPRGSLIASTQDLQAVAWSAGGALLAAGGLDTLVRVWRVSFDA